MGPIWKVQCCTSMGVDSAVESILMEQQVWEKQWLKRTGDEFHHKR